MKKIQTMIILINNSKTRVGTQRAMKKNNSQTRSGEKMK